MSIVVSILGFFVSSFALKLALGVLGQPSRENKYGTAVTVAGILSVVSLLTGFIPFVGWFIYAGLWLLIVRSVYDIGFAKSVVVAVLQTAIRGILFLLVALII